MMGKVILTFLMLNTVFLIGYSVGRRMGLKQGEKQGYNQGKALLRLKANTSRTCPICNKTASGVTRN
ncbi:hypothetical protein PRVXT_001505 [Proteinivorax tanatarense]|uniref:Uncharacterized protein n=1 Tax=Proteinivorax tanatarense TaxID=1260629 RepID=A0AAU7VQ61_9FIRM